MTMTRTPTTGAPVTRVTAPVMALLLAMLVLLLGTVLSPAATAATAATAGTDEADEPGAEPAAESVTWAVRPEDNEHGEARPNYQHELAAGATLSDALLVSNYSDSEITLAVYAADGFLNESGQLDVLAAGEESVALGSWVTLAADEVTIPPGEGVRVPFRITVPPSSPPGDVAGGIVTSLVTAGSDGTGVSVDRRLGSRILLRVDGELDPRLAVDDLEVHWSGSLLPWEPGTATVTYTLRNSGNLTLTGSEAATFGGLFGWGSGEAAGEEIPPMPPGSELRRELVLEDVLPFGRISGEVVVDAIGTGFGADLGVDPSDAPGELSGVVLVSSAFSFWAVPWLLVVVVGLLVAWLVLSRLARRRRRRAEERRVAEAVEAALAAQATRSPDPESPEPEAAAPERGSDLTDLFGPTDPTDPVDADPAPAPAERGGAP